MDTKTVVKGADNLTLTLHTYIKYLQNISSILENRVKAVDSEIDFLLHRFHNKMLIFRHHQKRLSHNSFILDILHSSHKSSPTRNMAINSLQHLI